MIEAMVVPVLANEGLLYRMIASIDHPVQHLVVIDNGDCVSNWECTNNPLVDKVSVLHLPANLGVAGSWNLGIKVTPFASSWLIVNFDVTWPIGSLKLFAGSMQRNALVLSSGDPEWCAFGLGDQVVQGTGLFDEALHPGYFEDNDYERRVLAAGFPIHRPGIQVNHDNSSTLKVGKYADRNAYTFARNHDYYLAKSFRGDLGEGRWSLRRRRELSWD